MWAFDGTTYTYCSKNWYDYTGQVLNTALTIELWSSTVHLEDIEKSGAIWLKNWETKTEHDNYFRLKRHDGIYRHFYCHAVPIYDKNGNFKHFQGFNLDINEQVEATEKLKENEKKLSLTIEELQKSYYELTAKEEELRAINEELTVTTDALKESNKELQKSKEKAEENEKQLRNYFQIGLLGMAITSVEKVWIEVNETICDLLGYSKEELSQKTWAELTHPEDIEIDFLHYNRVLNNEIDGYKIDKRFISKNGDTIYTELAVRCIRDNHGRVKYFLALINNISERKHLENSLIKSKEKAEENENYFRTIFENSPIGKSITSIDGTIKTNKAFSNMLGYTFEEFQSKNFTEIMHPEDIQISKNAIDELIEGKYSTCQFEKRYIHKKGSIVYTDVMTNIQRDEKGKPLFFITNIVDITERKKAEQLIRKLQKAVESSRVCIIITDYEGNIEYANPYFTENTGYTPEDYIGKNPRLLQTDFHDKPYYKNFWDTIKSGQTWEGEFYNRKKNGEPYWEKAIISPIITTNSEITHFVAIKTDITENKKIIDELHIAKEKAEENEKKWLSLTNNTNDTIVLTDINYLIQDINKTIYPTTKDSVIGTSVYKYIVEEYHAIMRDTFEKVIQTKLPDEYETKLDMSAINPELPSLWFIAKITPLLNNNDITGFILIATDITQRKNAEIELINAKQRAEENELLNTNILDLYKKSEDNDLDEVLTIYLEKAINLTYSEIGFLHFVNPDQNTLSLQIWSAITMKICDVPTKEMHYPISKAGVWVDCIKQRKPVIHNDYKSLQHKKGLPEGHSPMIREATIPIFEGEKIVAILGVGNKKDDYNNKDIDLLSSLSINSWNIIRRKKTEIELIQAKEHAEESDRLKTQFLLNMSHEIKTPMNAINGFSNRLNKQDLSDEKRKSFTSIIINSSNQLQSIVENILTISALETKQEKTNIQPVCINSIVVELLSIFKTQAFNHNIAIYSKQELTDKQSEIYTDKTKVTQILANLITNALKFTNEGYVEFGYNLIDNEFEFYVKDTGIGIKPEMQKQIFERFIQVETGLTRRYGGNGLGLSISKGFVELLGGKFWLHSELEKGSTFYFTIPYKPVHDVDKTISQKQQNINLTTVLVAEDEEYNFLFIEEILIDMDLKLIHAKDGKEAVEISKTNSEINLVLMDIKMPIMDGHTAAKQIKEFRPDLIIIAQSAYTLEQYLEKYNGNPFDDYISKPIQEDELKQKLIKYIDIQTNNT